MHTDNVQQTIWSACSTNAACNPSLKLYCNTTGQYTKLNAFNLNTNKVGSCVCQPYYYWSSASVGCTPQLTHNATCTNPTPATVLHNQCLDDTGLYCDASSCKCSCQANYYWSKANLKCCKDFKTYF